MVRRQTTERPEGVKAGCVEVIGTEPGAIVQKVMALFNDPEKYERMAKAQNPYGDGQASRRIVRRLLKEHQKIYTKPGNIPGMEAQKRR